MYSLVRGQCNRHLAKQVRLLSFLEHGLELQRALAPVTGIIIFKGRTIIFKGRIIILYCRICMFL